jgi:hypothetical protein
MFHRETDAAKVARNRGRSSTCARPRLAETYTAIPPRSAVRLLLVPAFQLSRMEHPAIFTTRTGCCRRRDPMLGRASMIAHETAHGSGIWSRCGGSATCG